MFVAFHEPSAWWLLLLVPLVLLLHFLRMHRATVLVPGILLWGDAPEDVRAARPFAPPRRKLPLYLQIACLLCAVAALARPYLPTGASSEQRVVFVVDVSASMGATDVEPSRLDAARREALDVLSGLAPRARVGVIVAGPTPRLGKPFTSDFEEVDSFLRTLTPSDAGADLGAAASMAHAILARVPGSIHVFTDAPLTRESGAMSEHIVRGDPSNVAIRRVRAEWLEEHGGGFLARVEVVNHGDSAASGHVALRIGGATIDVQAVAVDADASLDVELAGQSMHDGDVALEARLGVADHLLADNRAYCVLPATRPLRVLVVGRPSVFRDTLLDLNPPIERELVAPKAYLARDDVHLTVFDGVAPDELPTGDVLVIAPLGDLPFARRLGETSGHAVDWDPHHPLTRFVDFSAVALGRAWLMEVDARTESLVVGVQSPLVALRRMTTSRVVLLAFDAFDLSATDFALRPAGVIFMSNVVGWSRAGMRSVPLQVRAGQSISLPTDDAQYSVETPSGEVLSVYGSWSGTHRAGVYALRRDGASVELFAVNTPEEESAVGGEYPAVQSDVADAVVRSGGAEIWQWFALCALGLLTADWWAYHRRT